MEEKANDMGLKLSVTVRKLQNNSLSPRCYIMIAEKL